MAYIIRPFGESFEVYGEKTHAVPFTGSREDCESFIQASRRRVRARVNRLMRKVAMESIGMVKVRGAMGGTYWE